MGPHKSKPGWNGHNRRQRKDRRKTPADDTQQDRTVGRREIDILNAAAPLPQQFQHPLSGQTLRSRLYEIIDIERKDDLISKLFDIFLISLITLNVLAVILESVTFISNKFSTEFFLFELFSVIVFTLEFLMRLWTSVESPNKDYHHPLWGRLRYMMSPMALIDLLVILPFYLSFLFTVDLRFMRVLRLLRVFKLTRYSSAMTILLTVLKKESKAFGAALFVMLLLIVFSASMIFLFEHEAQPQVFSNIPNAMWWAVITLTTVGFGDAYPITAGGKFFGAAISVIGMGMVALPAGILASSFSEQLHIRRERYRDSVDDALVDGVLTEQEARQLRKLQDELSISVEEARNILHHSVQKELKFFNFCPNCGVHLQTKE